VSARRELLVVLAVCLVTYGTGLGDVPFYTRGEPREGLVVREMLRAGTWLVPERPDGEVARKPPLYYWLAAPVLRLWPAAPELALRLPSALAATAAVMVTWGAARTLVCGAAALPAALVLATTFEWMRAATSARVDMTLAAGLTLVVAAWILALRAPLLERRYVLVAIVGASLATLSKGPVGLVVPGLAAFAYAAWVHDRTVLRRLGVVWVLGVAGIVAGLWYLIAFAEQGRAFLDVVVKENVVRFVDTDDARTGHAHGAWYLPLLGLVGFLPWVPLLPLAVARRGDGEARVFATVWAATVLMFFSLANAKRSVYLLPAFPALALGVGAGLAEGGRPLARRLCAAYLPALLVMGALALALAVGLDPTVLLVGFLKPDDARGATALVAAAAAARSALLVLGGTTVLAALVIERARRAGRWLTLVLGVALLTAAWTATFGATVHPVIARTRSLRSFMTAVDRLVPRNAALATRFPADPGLRFYAPRPLVRLELESTAPLRYLLLWEDEWRVLRDERDQALAVLAVSEGRQSRRGSLALVVAPAGRLYRAAPPAQNG
jgi:4-amino-4-deoxy-L-arabinose transferase-like glycosyltransferase